MIKSQLEENKVFCNNYGTTTFEGYFYFIDLDSNLGCSRGWCTFSPTQTLALEYPAFLSDSLGFRFSLYDLDHKLIHSQDFYFKEGVPQHYFSAPYNELCYGSWHSLINEDEYKGMFEILEDDVVYDLGANIGAFTKWVDLKYPYKQIYGFEPTPHYMGCLEETFNGKDKIKFFGKAISKQDEIAHFNIFKDAVTNTLLEFENVNPDNFVGTTEVQCVNLEKFIIENNLLDPTFIKMDIEGAEYDAIEGMSDEFLKDIRIFLLEFHNMTYKEESNRIDKLFNVIQRMMNLGFIFDVKKGDRLFDGTGTIIFYNKNV